MTGTVTWAGLDVHARSIHAAVVDARSGELVRQRFGGETEAVVAWLAELPGPLRACYEAGPTGYGLARACAAAGVCCEVIAPSKTPRASGDRIKSDRRDAELLVRLLMAGSLTSMRVPAPELEAVRDLVRVRAWCDHLAAVDGLAARPAAIDEQLSLLMHADVLWQTVARLRCFRGVDSLTALALHVEVGAQVAGRLPAADEARVDVEDEGDVDEPRPGADVRQVSHPETVRGKGGEVALDEVGRAARLRVGDGGPPLLAAHRAPEAFLAHQALDGAAGHGEAPAA
jgi:Transposase